MDDDGTGWHDVLVGGWNDRVRERVVERVDDMTAGWRGPLVRTLRDPEEVPARWTEALHRGVLLAIREETGADLELLGSHAAWACYEEVWDELAARWQDGGDLALVPLRAEPRVLEVLHGCPPHVAEAAGADPSTEPATPLWLAGRLRIDLVGLRAALADDRLDAADQLRVETLLRLAQDTRPTP